MDVTVPFAPGEVIILPAPLGAGAVSSSQMIMLVLAVGMLAILMISTYRRTRQRRQAPRTSARELYAKLQKESEVKRDMGQVMLELDQLARQIHGRIDTRFAKLEAVIRDADERINELSRLLRAAEGVPGVDVTLGQEDPDEPSPSSDQAADSRYGAVYRLADSGLPVTQIAQEVGKTSGEVELILALRKASNASTSSDKVAASVQQS